MSERTMHNFLIKITQFKKYYRIWGQASTNVTKKDNVKNGFIIIHRIPGNIPSMLDTTKKQI